MSIRTARLLRRYRDAKRRVRALPAQATRAARRAAYGLDPRKMRPREARLAESLIADAVRNVSTGHALRLGGTDFEEAAKRLQGTDDSP